MDSIVYIVDNGQKVQAKLIRRFSLGSKIYAEIQVVDEDGTRNVLNSDLLVKDEFYQRKNEEEKLEEATQESPEEIISFSEDSISASSYKDGVASSMNISRGEAVFKSTEITSTLNDEETINERAKKVIAISSKGKRFNLGSIEELSENANVKKFELDPEAVKRVLDGKQKQHKGFTFEVK